MELGYGLAGVRSIGEENSTERTSLYPISLTVSTIFFPVECAHTGRHSVVIGHMKTMQTSFRPADGSKHIIFFDIHMEGIQTNTAVGPGRLSQGKSLISTIDKVGFKSVDRLDSNQNIL